MKAPLALAYSVLEPLENFGEFLHQSVDHCFVYRYPLGRLIRRTSLTMTRLKEGATWSLMSQVVATESIYMIHCRFSDLTDCMSWKSLEGTWD